MDVTAVKNCPFCGAQPRPCPNDIDVFIEHRSECAMTIRESVIQILNSYGQKLWNRRVPSPDVREPVKAAECADNELSSWPIHKRLRAAIDAV